MIKNIMISVIIALVLATAVFMVFMTPSKQASSTVTKEIVMYDNDGSKRSIILTTPSNTKFKIESHGDETQIIMTYVYKSIFGFEFTHKSIMNVGKNVIAYVK